MDVEQELRRETNEQLAAAILVLEREQSEKKAAAEEVSQRGPAIRDLETSHQAMLALKVEEGETGL